MDEWKRATREEKKIAGGKPYCTVRIVSARARGKGEGWWGKRRMITVPGMRE